jgi:type I protein arginine methyltransferase
LREERQVSEEDSLPFHHWLLADTTRTGTYQEALSQVIQKNDVVVDIGAGSGILSFFACQAGARKVYAVEMSDALALARELCTSNGFNDRVEFRQGRSQEIQLPELADVIVSDTGCSFGLQGGLLGVLLDAKKRFLKPGGRIIPHSLELLVVPVELNDRRNLDIWQKDRYGLDLSSIRRFAANTDYHIKIGAGDMLAPPASLTTIRFDEVESPYVAGEKVSIASRDGTLHGLGAWIRLELAPGISFTNSPLEPAVEWTQSFFPIEKPVELKTGDQVRAKIQTNDGEVWRWQVEVTEAANESEIRARFDQSTIWNFPVSPEHLKKQLPSYAPKLSRRGEAEKYLLNAFDGKLSAAELASELLERFGDCFPSEKAAAKFVSSVVWRNT